jgi:uncharacterized membrane protein
MQRWRLLRIITARPRLFGGLAIGLLSYFPLMAVHPLATRIVLAWDIGIAVYLVATAELFIKADHTNISRDAARQEEGEWSIFALVLLGAVMSFVAIFLFSNAAERKTHQDYYLGFVISTLVLSWLTTNIVFAYRYAHEYYSKDRNSDVKDAIEGGLEFPGEDNPDYLDFVYFSFVLGMTFQVSDVNIRSKKLRRLATFQGFIGFLFNTVILALSVNIAASLL